MFSGTPSWTAEDPWTNGTRLVDILRAPSYLCSDWKQPYSIHTVSELTQLLLRFCVFFYSCCVFKGKPYFSTLSILHYLCMTCMFGVRLKAEQAEIPPPPQKSSCSIFLNRMEKTLKAYEAWNSLGCSIILYLVLVNVRLISFFFTTRVYYYILSFESTFWGEML